MKSIYYGPVVFIHMFILGDYNISNIWMLLITAMIMFVIINDPNFQTKRWIVFQAAKGAGPLIAHCGAKALAGTLCFNTSPPTSFSLSAGQCFPFYTWGV